MAKDKQSQDSTDDTPVEKEVPGSKDTYVESVSYKGKDKKFKKKGATAYASNDATGTLSTRAAKGRSGSVSFE